MPSLHLHMHLQSRLLDRRDCSIFPHQNDLHIENFIEDASGVDDATVVDLVEVDIVEEDVTEEDHVITTNLKQQA